MVTTSAPDPEPLWFEPDPAMLRCLVCDGDFLDRALVRTFFVVDSKGGSRHHKHSALIRVPHLQRDLVLFDRHLECLVSSNTVYHAVSHVWDPQIALVQQSGRRNPTQTSKEPRRVAIEHPIRIYEGATSYANNGSLGEGSQNTEFWHDYISVPQWTHLLKDKILGVIHDIFASAHATIVYFDDLSPESIHKLYHGKTSDDVLQGLTDVCKARWFSRVWTAMEFVRSGTVQMMLADYSLCSEQSADPIFWKRLHAAWREQADRLGGQMSLEKKLQVGQGEKLLPWNLGTLLSTRSRVVKMNFGQAFASLSRRGCREERDFLYAMRGLLAADKEASAMPLSNDFEAEYHRLARASVKAGDYSPLLMTPAVPFVRDPRTTKGDALQVGYNDVFTWGLGVELSPPEYVEDISVPDDVYSTAVTLRLQTMGIVSTVHRLSRCYTNQRLGQNQAFGQCAHIAAQYTGTDVDRFVTALGSRVYGADSADVMLELGTSNNMGVVQKLLNDRYGSPGAGVWQGNGEHGARWLAEAMGLTKPRPGQSGPLFFCSSHGGTLHGGSTRLNCLIGVTCFTCHETDVFRVASFVELAELRHARAFRIPGLRYRFAHRDGVGLLEKNGHVVGRMIWATAVCQCQETEMVALRMPGLPPRRTSAST